MMGKVEVAKKEYSPSDITFAKSNDEERKVYTMSEKISSNSEVLDDAIG